jgi:hypothetical protein
MGGRCCSIRGRRHCGCLSFLGQTGQESFDARARILFRRQSGKHIDYIVHWIGNILEHYAEETICTFSIDSYDPQERKFHISYTSLVRARSYIDDIQTSYVSNVHYEGGTPPPVGGTGNKLDYIRIYGAVVCGQLEFTDKLVQEIKTTIDKDGLCAIEHRVNFELTPNFGDGRDQAATA